MRHWIHSNYRRLTASVDVCCLTFYAYNVPCGTRKGTNHMAQYQNFKTTNYSDALLEIISNQLQMSNLHAVEARNIQDVNIPKQIQALRMKIINQRAELGIDVGGV
jgi:hypothetical protein